MTAEKKYTVYIHTSPEGKKYIGCTGMKPEMRWKNGDGYKGQTNFFNDIIKFGWDNFNHEIIESELTRKNAYNLEQDLIAELKTSEESFIYNIASGRGKWKPLGI